MTTDALAATDATATSAPALRPELRERVEDAIRSSRSPATLRAYRSQFAGFARFADREGLPAIPAAPGTVAAYLADLGETRKVSTVRLAAAAIAHAHRTADRPNPVSTETVRRTIAGIARAQSAAGIRQRQATAITGTGIAAIAATIRANGNGGSSPAAARRARRDTALLSLMRDCLLRRSEASAATWGDLSTVPDGSGRLLVRRSKTDQAGEGVVLFVGASTMEDLAAIRPADAAPDAAIFGLSPSQIHRIIRARAEDAGISGASGHSLRVGTAQDLATAGAELPAIMTAGRWSDPKMVSRYTRRAAAGRGAVARFLHGA